MEHEARIGYLCFQAARDQFTLDEECELLGYAAVQPEIWQFVEIERL